MARMSHERRAVKKTFFNPWEVRKRMPSDSYQVFASRSDGSRVSLWRGESSGAAHDAEKLMRTLGGSYTEIYIEKNGKRWMEERRRVKFDE